MVRNEKLIEFIVRGGIDDVNAELERRGIASVDVLSIQHEAKSHLPIGESRAAYRVISRST